MPVAVNLKRIDLTEITGLSLEPVAHAGIESRIGLSLRLSQDALIIEVEVVEQMFDVVLRYRYDQTSRFVRLK